MKLSPQLKSRLRWQNRIFVILFFLIIILLAWLSNHFTWHADLTSSNSNYPSNETEQILQVVDSSIEIKAFVSPDNRQVQDQIKQLIAKYKRIKNDINLAIIDPVREPQLVREFSIQSEGELIVSINNEQEHVRQATEVNLTNAINHLSRSSQDWILFLEGHNERSPFGDTGFDYGAWNKYISKNGLNVRGYNLASNAQIPENTLLLIIADPQKQFLQGELNILLDYIAKGGNLLWLAEAGENNSLEPLAETLGIEILPGIVIDPNTQAIGINDPRFTLITDYPASDITPNSNSISIFPTAIPLDFFGSDDWDASIILETLPRTWSAEGNVNEISIDTPPSINGPLVIGYSLTRTQSDADNIDEVIESDILDEDESLLEIQKSEQRIIVVGDSDFVSDAYIGEAGNLEIASNILNWLIQNERSIDITVREKHDRTLNLSQASQVFIGLSFLVIIPVSLLLCGIVIWRKRRKT